MMKKSFFRCLGLVALVFALLAFFCACEQTAEEVKPVSLEILTSHDGAYVIGEDIVLDEISFRVTYSNKETKVVRLNESMLALEEYNYFFTVGAHSVMITYEGLSIPLQIEVVESQKGTVYQAQFFSLGGTEVPVFYGSVITAFSVPERKGYTFDGWYAITPPASGDKIVFSGSKAVEPYVLTKNTSFYAKWIDDRICTVSFVDYDDTLLFTKEIHYGEAIKVSDYPYPKQVKGKRFLRWNVKYGDPDNVTANLVVQASFIVDKCTVSISYANSAGKIIDFENSYDYGEVFDVNEYTLPTKEGYSSRWVIYYDHSESENKDSFVELPEDGKVVLEREYTKICAYDTINTYDLIIFNGAEKQSEERLKNGNLELIRTYYNASAMKNFSVEWNSDFDFSEHTQDPDISTPARIVDGDNVTGYVGEWCVVVTSKTGAETWYNLSGQIWDESELAYVGTAQNDWELLDNEGKYVARITNKRITAIKGSIVIKAKYKKIEYTVTLARKHATSGNQEQLVTFTIKYYTDFNMYDKYFYNPSIQSDVTSLEYKSDFLRNDPLVDKVANLSEYSAIEQFYLYENTDYIKKALASSYYSTGEEAHDANKDDWSITWYKSIGQSEQDLIDFIGGETVTIKSNTTFYCKDTDNRKYNVYFHYDYDFSTGTYNTVTPVLQVTEKQTVQQPNNGNLPTISDSYNGVELSYAFSGWFSTPYEGYLKTGYRGEQLTNFAERKHTVHYYAHYKCDTTYNVTIYDSTQSIAYIGKDAFAKYAVADNTISYTLPRGSGFSIDMLYKGKSDEKGIISGQKYYNDYLYDSYIDAEYLREDGLKALLTSADKFGTGNSAETTIKTLNAIIAVLNAFDGMFDKAMNDLYKHDYTFGNSEYEYLLRGYENRGGGSIGSFVEYVENLDKTEYSQFLTILNAAGYNKNLMSKLGNLEDLIKEYVIFIKKIYESGLSEEKCGFTGLNYTLLEDYKFKSDSERINAAIEILTSYVNFLKVDLSDYKKPELTPKYEDSKRDLNLAYGLNIENGEEKYTFSGWFRDADYTSLYCEEFIFAPFYVDGDVSALYAKWTDVTKGTEGLLYEEVTYKDENGIVRNGYVLVDFVNAALYAEKYANSDLYYVTTDDSGNVPKQIVVNNAKIDVQIPATIDKYLDKTAEARAEYESNEWNSRYKNYFIKSGSAYIAANSVFDEKETYYVKEEYKVIGIASGAFNNYKMYVKEVTLPLNLYFIEEGAFKDVYCEGFNRSAPKDKETVYDYVVLKGTEKHALYQKEACPYTEIIGRASLRVFRAADQKTLIAYAKEIEDAYYALMDGTTGIGENAFMYAKHLLTLTNVDEITVIGKEAFAGSSIKTYGNVDGSVIIGKKVKRIEESAFAQCTNVKTIEMEDGSAIEYVGKNVFLGSGWQNAKRGVVMLSYVDSNGKKLVALLGVANDAGSFESETYNENGEADVNGAYRCIKAIGADGEVKALSLYKNDKLTKVIVNAKISMITAGAFNGSYGNTVSAVELKDCSSLAYIDDNAFASCPYLDEISFGNATAPIRLGSNVFLGKSEDSKITLKFVDGSDKTTATSDESWKNYENITTIIG